MWVCPYCGTENEQDERIGRREPLCRHCKEQMISPEELQKLKEREIRRLERDLDRINDQAGSIKESIEFHESIIAEHTGPLTDLRQELEEIRDEYRPIKDALKKWENQTIHYEPRDRAFIAEQDPHQAKLPFVEAVPA